MNWHNQNINELMKALGSGENGLTDDAVLKKLEKYGVNELKEKKKNPLWLIFLRQFFDFMTIVLIVAAIISGIVGELVDSIIIMVIVILNAIIGFSQEYKAEKAMDALKNMALPHSTVIRNGQPDDIICTQLVPGDLVILEAGTLIPADMRLTNATALLIEESALTGESVSVEKNTEILKEEDLLLADRKNMAYKGTTVSHGRGKGIIVATGMETELGKIAQMLQEEPSPSPLRLRMMEFGKKLSYIILLICILLFGVGLLRGEEPVKMLLISISLAIAAIPEALPALITIALAKGAKRLVKRNALVRRLSAVETLGSVTYICSDKTGTLTQNKMTVVKVAPATVNLSLSKEHSLLEYSMWLNQDVIRAEDGAWIGDPTEIALVEYVRDKIPNAELENISSNHKRLAELPFDSERRCMTTIHQYDGRFIAISKGAVEAIQSRLKPGEPVEQMIKQSDELSKEGMRVLAFGYRFLDRIPEKPDPDKIETELYYTGLIGMIDPPRTEVKTAIEECKTAGIKIVMITGDHQNTATAIASQIGILQPGDLIMPGIELKKLSEDELDEKVEKITVYARVSPEQKLQIVKSLQRKDHFVSMTGDGVNDAPSLRLSNIGVAMGITGTDVSKEAADMILLDDNFITIVNAVKEGRRIYDNIRKFVKYIMTCNGAEIWTIFLAPLLGLPMPLLPVHILWINLVTDGLPGLAISSEKAEKNVMLRPPRPPGESLFAEGIAYHIIWVGLLMAFITLGTQAAAIRAGDTHWQTMVFTVLSLSQLGHVYAIRSEKEFIFKTGLFSNRPMLAAILFTLALQIGIIYIPFANEIFHTQPLSIKELLVCLLLSSIVFHAVELEKWIKKKFK